MLMRVFGIALFLILFGGATDANTIIAANYGVVGDSVTDNSSYLNAAILALNSVVNGTLLLPSGTIKTSACHTITYSNTITVQGYGDSTLLLYTGPSSTCDLWTVGTNAGPVYRGITFRDLRIDSQILRTSGYCLRINNIGTSKFINITCAGQEGSTNLYGCFWFNGVDDVIGTGLRCLASGNYGNGILANGSAAVGAGLQLSNFGIVGHGLGGGIHIAGGIGGVYINGPFDVSLPVNDLAVDESEYPSCNREIFLGNGSLDATTTGANVFVSDANTCGTFINFMGTWIASGSSHGIWVSRGAGMHIAVTGTRLYNLSGDGIRVDDAAATVTIFANNIQNNGGWGVNPNVSLNNVQIGQDNYFAANALGSINPAYR